MNPQFGTITDDDTADPVVTYTAWPYSDDLEDAADGTDPTTRANWTASGNSADRYRTGTYSNGKAVFNNNIYRPANYLIYGPDLNSDGLDWGYEVEIDENRAGNAGATNGNAWETSRQSALLFYRGEGDHLEVGAGDTGILPAIANVVNGGTSTRVGNTFRHMLQAAPTALPGGSPSVKTLSNTIMAACAPASWFPATGRYALTRRRTRLMQRK